MHAYNSNRCLVAGGFDDSDNGSAPQRTWATHAAHPADPETLTALATTHPGELSGTDLVDAIVASEKALSLLAGLQMRLMAALAVPFVAGDPMRLAARMARKNCITGDDDPDNVQLFVEEAATCLAASEIAAALRISPVTGGIRVREATTMTTVLTPTLQALEAGVLDRGKARVITEHCQPLTPEDTAQLQELVLPDAAELSTSELRERTGEAVIVVDPDGSADRHRAAATRRDLTLRAQPDAMATLNAFLTADGAVKIFQISDLLATSTAGVPGDPRGIGARRIDALVDIADQLITHGYLDLADFISQPLPDSTTPRAPVTAPTPPEPRTPPTQTPPTSPQIRNPKGRMMSAATCSTRGRKPKTWAALAATSPIRIRNPLGRRVSAATPPRRDRNRKSRLVLAAPLPTPVGNQ